MNHIMMTRLSVVTVLLRRQHLDHEKSYYKLNYQLSFSVKRSSVFAVSFAQLLYTHVRTERLLAGADQGAHVSRRCLNNDSLSVIIVYILCALR